MTARLLQSSAVVGLVLALVTPRTNAEGVSAAPYERDLVMLTSQATRIRALRGPTAPADLESHLSRLRSLIGELKSAASRISSVDGRLRYLNTMEIGPKQREFERLQSAYDAERAQLNQQSSSLEARILTHNTSKNFFQEGEEAAFAAYRANAAALNAERDALRGRFDRLDSDWQARIEEARGLLNKVIDEYNAAIEKRTPAVQAFNAAHENYNAARAALVTALGETQGAESSGGRVPLTAFAQENRAAAEATLHPVVAPPVGPGNNRNALDQLRLVTKSSQSGAGSDIGEISRTQGGYGFDSDQGVGYADLPSVDVPAAGDVREDAPAPDAPQPDKAVPLVVPDAKPEVQASPKVQQAAQQQSAGFSELDRLYQKRNELRQQGASASPQEWTQVVQDISKTQAAVNYSAVVQKLAEAEDLSLVVPRKRPKVEVPSPVTSESK